MIIITLEFFMRIFFKNFLIKMLKNETERFAHKVSFFGISKKLLIF